MSEQIRPTKKQQETLEFIRTFIGEHGYSPSYREIMAGLKYNSVATASLHVNNLIKRGHLVKRDKSARSLEPVGSADTVKLATNQIKPADEKWLVQKVDHFFKDAEGQAQIDQGSLDELYVLIGALKVLGLDGAAQSFIPRLSTVKSKLTTKK